MTKGIEAKKSYPNDPNPNASKRSYFYALQSRKDNKVLPNEGTGM